VKGTPVKELALSEEAAARRAVDRQAQKRELARMSAVKENKVFVELKGIPEYRIGPLDVLEISSHVGDKVDTATVTVNNKGNISYSFIDDLHVAGLTPTQVDDLLTRKLSAYIRKPRIDILVKEFKSKYATVLGELASIRGTLYGSKGASGKIYLEGKTYVINLYDIISKGDESLNVIIDHGDVVDVPELPVYGERVYVMGEVNAQGIYPLEDARDLLAAVSLAGSFTPLAKEENTLIVRGREPGKKPLVMMADMKALLRKADLTQNIQLQDGDLIYVPPMRIADINRWITNTMPLLDFIFYPARFEDTYFLRRYLHIDRRH